MNKYDKLDRSKLEPAEVGGPIDAVAGDESSHPSVQKGQAKKEAIAAIKAGENTSVEPKTAQENIEEARKNLPPDGMLPPDFDGTQPKVMPDGTLRVISQEKLEAERSEGGDMEISADENAENHDEEDEGDLTVAQLKEALDEAGVEYTSSMRKAELRELYDQIGQ